MAWISIDADTSWQSLAIAQEIATAFNKRASACNENSIETRLSVSAIGQDCRVYDFVIAIQDGIEGMATKWANPSTPLSGQTASPANFSTVSAFMARAGLTQTGYWRRISEGGSQPETWTSYTASGWSYGKISSKDLVGPWLWADIQAALSAMTRIVLPIYARSNAYANDASATASTPWSIGDPYPAPSGNVAFASININTKSQYDITCHKWVSVYGKTNCEVSTCRYTARFYGAYTEFSSYQLVFRPTGDTTFYEVTGWPTNTLGKTRSIGCTLNTVGYLSAFAWSMSSATPSWASVAAGLPDGSVGGDPLPYESFWFMELSDVVVVTDYAFSPA